MDKAERHRAGSLMMDEAMPESCPSPSTNTCTQPKISGPFPASYSGLSVICNVRPPN